MYRSSESNILDQCATDMWTHWYKQVYLNISFVTQQGPLITRLFTTANHVALSGKTAQVMLL